jgi:hypothetical protein
MRNVSRIFDGIIQQVLQKREKLSTGLSFKGKESLSFLI